MSDQEELKQHFAQRVIHQAREVLEVWQQLQRSEWNEDYHAALTEATTRLRRFADRFEQTEHSELALNIEDCLSDIRDNRGRLSSSTISTLSQLLPHRLRPPAQAELSLAAGNTSHIDQSDSHDTAGGVNMLLSRHPRRPSLHESRAGP